MPPLASVVPLRDPLVPYQQPTRTPVVRLRSRRALADLPIAAGGAGGQSGSRRGPRGVYPVGDSGVGRKGFESVIQYLLWYNMMVKQNKLQSTYVLATKISLI